MRSILKTSLFKVLVAGFVCGGTAACSQFGLNSNLFSGSSAPSSSSDTATAVESDGVSVLTWAPPTLTNPKTIVVTEALAASAIQLDDLQDYRLVCDPSQSGALTLKRLAVQGGHNIVMIGCSLKRALNTANSVYPPVNGVCASIANPVNTVSFQKQTGTVYIEGLLVDLQNTLTNPNNYGVDAIDVGESNARLAAGILNATGASAILQLTNSTATTTVTISLAGLTTPAQIATAIANQVTTAAPLGVTATASNETITFSAAMPEGNRTRIQFQGVNVQLSRADGSLRGADYVLQNVRTQNTWSTYCGHHADGIQNQGDLDKLYIDHFTALGGYQGIQLQPAYNVFDMKLYNLNTRYMDPDYTHLNAYGDVAGSAGFSYWLGTGDNPGPFCTGCEHSYELKNNYAEERTGMGAWALSSVAPNSRAAYGNEIYNGNPDQVYFPHSSEGMSITGFVSRGIPAAGDFVQPSRIVDSAGHVIYKQATTYLKPSP